jgi:hypothetical protein
MCKLSLWDFYTEEQKVSGTLRRKMAETVIFLVTGRVISDVNDDNDVVYLVLCCFSQIVLVHPC